MSKEKKKFKDTKIGVFLKEKAPGVLHSVLDIADDYFPPAKILTSLMEKAGLGAEDMKEFEAINMEYEKELTARQVSEDVNVTERWKADSMSDSWMSKNARPITLLSLLVFLYGIILSDSISIVGFEVKDGYVDLLSQLLTVTVVAYMGSRGAEKIFKKK